MGWFFFWIFARFLRIGEAAVPGPSDPSDASQDFGSPSWILPNAPSFQLGIGNPSGINNKLHMLDSFGHGWFHLVETHASRYQQSRFQSHLKQLSSRQGRILRSCVGAPAPLRSGSLTAGAWTGVLNFAAVPLRQVPVRWPQHEYESGRIMVTAARVGGIEIVGGTVYCPPRGPTNPQAAALSEQLLTPLTSNLVLGRAGLRFICGDFNGHSDAYPQQRIWRQHGWQEVQELFRDRFGCPVQATCKEATTPDQLWVSPELIPYITNVGLWNLWPDHKMVLAGLDLPALRAYDLQWSLPGHIAWEKVDKDKWSEVATQSQWGPTSFSPEGGTDLSSVPGRLDLDPALSQFDSTRAFHAWSAAFEDRVTACLTCPVAAADHSFKGRGSKTKPKQRRVQAPILRHSRQGEYVQIDGLLNRSVGRWFQQLRRLQSYQHAACSARASDNYASRIDLWNSILHAHGFVGGFSSWWLTRPIKHQGSPWTLSRLIVADFAQNYRKYEAWQQARRAESTQSKLLSSTKAIFSPTRKPAKASLDGLEDKHSQVIILEDSVRSLVSVPVPFRSEGVLYWTLQGQPAVVSRVDQHLHVDSDLVLASGQTLTCHTWVHDTTVIHEKLEALWRPWWNRHSDVPESTWDQACQFADQHMRGPPIDLPEITHADWHKAIHSFKQTAAAGPDGWTRSDLIHCTDSQVQAILDFYHAWERGAPCPAQWQIGLVHCLQKRESSAQVNDFRPITVLSMFYRVYAGIRAGQILAQLAERADQFQSGFLKGRQAQDQWFFVGTCLEVSAQTGTPVHGAVADLIKAYNTLPRKATFHLLSRLGLPAWFVSLWSNYLDSFCRYFTVGRSLGNPIFSTSGYPEGCPLSCVAMAALDMMWHMFQNLACSSSIHLSFVDNLEVVSSDLDSLQASIRALHDFCAMLDLSLDPDSFYTWSSSAQGRLHLKHAGFQVSLGQRDLGGQVTYCQQLRNKVLQDRVASVVPFFVKLRSSKLPHLIKVANLLQVLWPRALHGCEAVQLGDQHIQKLRSGAMKALHWSRAGASPIARLGLLNLKIDPEWYQLRCVMRTFRHQFSTNHVVRDWWALFSQDLQHCETHGPFGKLCALLQELQLSIDDQGRLWFTDRCSIPVIDTPLEVIERVMQLFFFRLQASSLQSRRGFTDLHGFDLTLTQWGDGKRTIADKAHLDIVRDGSFISDDMKAKYDVRISPVCQWCHVPATRGHKYADCSKYSDIRRNYPTLCEEWGAFPECVQQHGLLPENPWQLLVWEALHSLPDTTSDFRFQPVGEVWHCFTDGACRDVCCADDSLAAWAVVVWGCGVLASGPLVGIQQSIIRAETVAVLAALKWGSSHVGTMHLWIDNQTVVTHLRDLLRGVGDIALFEHGDLWKQIQTLVSSAAANIVVHKVASHVPESLSLSPLEDFMIDGNRLADLQAGLANQVRPRWFWQVWNVYQTYRQTWKSRMQQLHDFHLAIAARDKESTTEAEHEADDSDPVEPVYSFDWYSNDAIFSIQATPWKGRLEFAAQHDFAFRSLAASLLDWMIVQDETAAEARVVSQLELFVGFRIHRSAGPLTLAGGVANPYQVVTFAADFTLFKRLVKFLRDQTGFSLSPYTVDLSSINVIPPQVGVQIGWSRDLQETVFSSLLDFIGSRPVTNHQGFARPWHI